MEEEKEEFINPIDPDKIAENPHLLPYAHTVGGSVIKPIDKGRVNGLSLDAMYEQTNVHLSQIRKQVETLIQQAQEVHDRVEISEKIYIFCIKRKMSPMFCPWSSLKSGATILLMSLFQK